MKYQVEVLSINIIGRELMVPRGNGPKRFVAL